MSTRREARERVMQALYAKEIAGGATRHFVATLIEPEIDDAATLEFATALFQATLDRIPTIDEIVAAHADNWEIGRITAIDRAVLRMATCELLAFEDIPPKVTIDEAIEIVKRYSTPRSGRFVNGVLDAILADLQEQGKLRKSGRGLVGMETLNDDAPPSGDEIS